MDEKITETLSKSFSFAKDKMPELIEKIRYRIQPINLAACYSSLGNYHTKLGTYSYFVDGDTKALKQHFYIACQLKRASMECDPEQWGILGTNEFIFYGLLSDSPTIIEWLKVATSKDMDEARDATMLSYFYVYMYQLALRGDWKTLEEKVTLAGLAVPKKKKTNDAYATIREFFLCLARQDKAALEQVIMNQAEQRQMNPFIPSNIIAQNATLMAKLCWIKGLPVEINSPYVPMALMPVSPLENYEDIYDFLQPGWQPLKLGLMERIRRKLKP